MIQENPNTRKRIAFLIYGNIAKKFEDIIELKITIKFP